MWLPNPWLHAVVEIQGATQGQAPLVKKKKVIFNQMLKGAPGKILYRPSNLMGVCVAGSRLIFWSKFVFGPKFFFGGPYYIGALGEGLTRLGLEPALPI
jgi:hypothetical protein